MKLTMAVFANGGGVTPNGLMDLQGAGWESWSWGSFPALMSGVIALVIDVDPMEVSDEAIELDVDVFDSDSDLPVFSTTVPIVTARPAQLVPVSRQPVVVPFSTIVRGTGVRRAVVAVDGKEIGAAEIAVLLAPPAATE